MLKQALGRFFLSTETFYTNNNISISNNISIVFMCQISSLNFF